LIRERERERESEREREKMTKKSTKAVPEIYKKSICNSDASLSTIAAQFTPPYPTKLDTFVGSGRTV